jgi:hypothetical protein
VLDRIGRIPVLGRLLWALVPRLSARMLRSSLPEARRAVLAAEIRRNQGQVCRRMVRRYFEYLDHGRSPAQRLCDSGTAARIVFGDHEEVGLTTEERRVLDACAQMSVEVWAGATHFLVTEEPRRVAELIAATAGLELERLEGVPREIDQRLDTEERPDRDGQAGQHADLQQEVARGLAT